MAVKKTLIIDHYDSFSYILKQYVGELKGNPEVHFADKITVAQIRKVKPTHIILSPGPGTVEKEEDIGNTMKVIKAFHKTIPILGVCLGHQALGKFFGAKIVQAPQVMHGKRSTVYHLNTGLFKGLTNPIKVMRYHSLVLDTPFWMQHPEVDVVAHTPDFLIMGIQHKKYPLFGIQFHPESFGTEVGKGMVGRFLKY